MTVDPDKVGILIRPGGRNIRALKADFGAEQIQVKISSKGLFPSFAVSPHDSGEHLGTHHFWHLASDM